MMGLRTVPRAPHAANEAMCRGGMQLPHINGPVYRHRSGRRATKEVHETCRIAEEDLQSKSTSGMPERLGVMPDCRPGHCTI